MLILGINPNLIISRKTVHKGKYLTSHTLIQNMINKWCGEIIFRIGTIQVTKMTDTIQVTKMSAYVDRSLLLIN